MKPRTSIIRRVGLGLGIATALAVAVAVSAAESSIPRNHSAPHSGTYVQRNLVSDGAIAAEHLDANLVNAWGIAFNPYGFSWVANNHTGTSTLYDGDGNAQSLVVSIPTPTADSGGSPTGIVYNGSPDFIVTGASGSAASRFIFATEDGIIAAWAFGADSTHAIMVVDNSPSEAIYKGLALSAGGSGQLLYATDFHNAKVDVFDSTFAPVTLAAGAFTDSNIPSGFAPFGIQNIGGNLYITYAMQDADAEDDVAGHGLGYVDVYSPNGVLIRRFAARGNLNAPWGVALAPDGFGSYSNTILIGNFGDGRINAFDPKNGTPAGTLRDANRKPLEIEGLWGIAFGNGIAKQPVNTLFFAAGPSDEEHGLYGRIDLGH